MAEKRWKRENYRKLDNTTKARKIEIRRRALGFLERPVVMETHGGFGAIWRDCYANIPAGVVFEKDPKKTAALAEQRPTWAVYEADCENAIAAGVGFHLPINYFDFDPYGSPWSVIQALFSRTRVDWPARIVLVANDGYRLAIKLDCNTEGAGNLWFGDRAGEAATDIWRVPKPNQTERTHLTEKPVELPSRAINNSCPPGGIVWEPFAGTGSTLLACEKHGRIGRGVEYSPTYAATILERFQTATGVQPVLIDYLPPQPQLGEKTDGGNE